MGILPSATEAAAVAILAEFRRKAEETHELHASSPSAGEGNCWCCVLIDTSQCSHSYLTISPSPLPASESPLHRLRGFRPLHLLPLRECGVQFPFIQYTLSLCEDALAAQTFRSGPVCPQPAALLPSRPSDRGTQRRFEQGPSHLSRACIPPSKQRLPPRSSTCA